MRLALVLTLAWCVLPVRAQSPPPAKASPIIQLLESYGSGRYPTFLTSSLKQFRSDLQTAGTAWVAAGDAADRARRHDVLALAALDAAIGADPNSWSDARALVEWGCAYLREGSPTPFQWEWMRLSIALAEQNLDETYLLDQHLRHVDRQFPQDAEFSAAHVLGRYELNRLTRRPFPSALALLQRTVSSSPLPGVTHDFTRDGATQRVLNTTALLEEQAKDPALRPRGLLRLGILEYELGQAPAGRRHLAAALDVSSDPFELYLAHLVTGLAFDFERNQSGAADAYQKAVAIDPALKSGAVQLAAHVQFLARPDEASALLEKAFATRPAIEDPWQYPCAHCSGWNRRIFSIHLTVRR